MHLRPSSRARDESYLNTHVLPRFGDVPLARIQNSDIRAWIADLAASGVEPATVGKAKQLISKILDAAVDDRRIPTNPAVRVPVPRVEREEMRYLTPAQVNHLADTIDPRYRALVLLGAYCGLRLGGEPELNQLSLRSCTRRRGSEAVSVARAVWTRCGAFGTRDRPGS